MFYRFNAHKQAPASDRRGQDKHAAVDKAARRIASGIIRVQRRWAELMGKWAGKLPEKWLRILTLVSLAATSSFFLSLIMPGLGLPALIFQEGLPSLSSIEARQKDGASGGIDTLTKQPPKARAGARNH